MSKPKAKGRRLDHTTDNLTISTTLPSRWSVGPPSCSHRKIMSPPFVFPTAPRSTPLSLCSLLLLRCPLPSRASSLPTRTASSSSLSLVTREPAHRHLKYIRALSTGMIWLPAKGRVAMFVKPTDIEETAQDDGEHCSDTDAGADPFDIHLLDAKLQLKLEQKMKMKLPKWVRLRRKKLVHKRRMRKKGRWPRTKTK